MTAAVKKMHQCLFYDCGQRVSKALPPWFSLRSGVLLEAPLFCFFSLLYASVALAVDSTAGRALGQAISFVVQVRVLLHTSIVSVLR